MARTVYQATHTMNIEIGWPDEKMPQTANLFLVHRLQFAAFLH
jgi:hypothetical protein